MGAPALLSYYFLLIKNNSKIIIEAEARAPTQKYKQTA